MPAKDLLTADRWADMLLNVRNDKIRAGEMTNPRMALGIIHCIRQIPDKDNILAVFRELPQAKVLFFIKKTKLLFLGWKTGLIFLF